MDINRFRRLPLLGILRGIRAEMVEPLVETIVSSGLQTIEVTMNTEDAPGLIQRMVETARGRLAIGAGTVLSMEALHSALDSGATFIVMPILIPGIVEHCAANSIPVFPGALTPREIYEAWTAGATMVKVFPSGFFGPRYFNEIKGPFAEIELLACGGVNTDTIAEFFSCQASAAAFGGSVFRKDWLEQGNFSSIRASIEALIARIPERFRRTAS